VFWIIFLLAVGVGGPGALTGLPSLADMVMPTGVLEAQASAGWQDIVVQPLSRVVTHYTPPPVAEAAAAPAPPVAKTRPQPAIAILIDDMGNDVSQNRRAIALPQEVSLSFLPDPSETPRLAEEAHRAGHELLVHVPMEAPRDRDGSLKNALRRDLPVEENIRRLDWALSRVPYYAGINNHEGSLFTADRLALIPVAERLYGRGVFFLDSRTTPLSQVVPVARAFGVPSSDRDVFLDDDQSSAAVQAQLRELEKIARANGVAIAIGHPHAATLEILTRWCATQQGFRLIPVSTAIRMKTEWEMGVELASRK
jgi:polysaccharide deacetylase 2 family uncharacterized protein YibQ